MENILNRVRCLNRITNFREILAAVILLAIMIGIGLGIFFSFSEWSREGIRKYEVAYKTNSADEFNHAKVTKLGSIMANGEFSTIDPVSDERVDGMYMKIKVITERYTQHTRTYTDSKGKTQIETYYEWDHYGVHESIASKFIFFGNEGLVSEIPDLYEKKETVYDGNTIFPLVGDLRYQYYVIPEKFEGTGFWIFGNEEHLKEVWRDKTPEEVVKEYQANAFVGPITFAIIWGILTLGGTIVFISFDNDWLLDRSRKQHGL